MSGTQAPYIMTLGDSKDQQVEHEKAHASLSRTCERESVANGKVPVGARDPKRGELSVKEASAHGHSWMTGAHAELRAIQAACQALRSDDLIGLTMYCTRNGRDRRSAYPVIR
jgi:tRNA(Arg) A34 adenosine deaminase TadA